MSESQRKVDPVEAERMFRAGASNLEVATRFGVTVKRAGWYRARLGLPMPTVHNRRIDPDELRRLILAGHSTADLAKRFRVKRNSIVGARRLIGMPSNDVSARPRHSRDRIAALTRDGFSAKQIATELGCSPKTVTRVRRELGITQGPPPSKYPQELRDRALAMLEDGASYNEVARTLKVGDRWVRRNFPGMGWTPDQVYEFRRMQQQLDSLPDHV
jgi:DNA-binding CsgD family transcriptional regulator